ncbi:unnamed protein product [Angiostrongylus costaricensis]|uniref:VHS domain-containing protein n=1 Tax=Angiostrongylus costaricensis TaxID=334426 RepID=A0A0R3PFC8_ANGCS|nr:unnamed protein product [Angiostrongylus costaricensis]
MSSSELGIALDSQPNWKEVKVLISLLKVFQQHATHIHMDSPVVELLVKEVNTKKINALLLFFSQNRKCEMDLTCGETAIAPMMKSQLPIGPMFPSLKQFTVTSNPQQLVHLSRLVHYAVAVDMIYQKKEIDLVCLQVVLGESWCRSKQRLFRHVNSFKQWSDASSLGVRYLQQFHGTEKRRGKAKC